MKNRIGFSNKMPTRIEIAKKNNINTLQSVDEIEKEIQLKTAGNINISSDALNSNELPADLYDRPGAIINAILAAETKRLRQH